MTPESSRGIARSWDMVYRSQADALEARLNALDAELRERACEREHVAQLLVQARTKERELKVASSGRWRRWLAALALL